VKRLPRSLAIVSVVGAAVLVVVAYACGGKVPDEPVARAVVGTKLGDDDSPPPYEPPLTPIPAEDDSGLPTKPPPDAGPG
jgi:hypothetical protein